MSRPLKIAAAGAISILFFAAVTGTALEANGVAVLETRGPDGATRHTRVWFAEQDGAVWLEAATPEREWLHDVERSPRVRLRSAGQVKDLEAIPLAGDEAHAEIRSLLRAKYGWRDWWVGLLQDTSRSIAVRLVAVAR